MSRKKNPLWYAGIILLVGWVIMMIFLYSGQQPEEERLAYILHFETPYCKGQATVCSMEDGEVYFVTTAHAMMGMKVGDTFDITCKDGTMGQAELHYLSDTVDVAFLKAKEEDLGVVSVAKVVAARIEKLEAEDGLWALYYDNGEMKELEGKVISPWIYVEDFATDMMLMSLDATDGMSGCAIVDADNCFFGILCGKNEEGEAAVLPYAVIESEWMKAK